MKLIQATPQDYPPWIELWEASVRATHHFLAEDDVQQLKPLILGQYFDAVDLTCAKNTDGTIVGFSGVYQGHLEMLFIAPAARGQGVGRFLARHAIDTQGVTKVDVNEQNEQAVGFYLHLGFSVQSRSAVDGQGRAYPLLHLAL